MSLSALVSGIDCPCAAEAACLAQNEDDSWPDPHKCHGCACCDKNGGKLHPGVCVQERAGLSGRLPCFHRCPSAPTLAAQSETRALADVALSIRREA